MYNTHPYLDFLATRRDAQYIVVTFLHCCYMQFIDELPQSWPPHLIGCNYAWLL